MANRHLSRSIVLQTLFEWDFNSVKNNTDIKEIAKRNLKEFAPGLEDDVFVFFLLEEIIKKAKAGRSKLYYIRDKAVKDVRKKLRSVANEKTVVVSDENFSGEEEINETEKEIKEE